MTWETVRLGDLLGDVVTGFASRDNLDEGVFQIRMNNLSSDSQWDWSKKRRVRPTERQFASAMVRPGDVIFNATNSPELVGKSGLMPELDEPAVISNHFLRLRVRPDLLDSAYLQHWLLQQFARGVFRARAKAWINQATLDRAALMSMPIPLPPLPEQRRIAAILDEADALRQNLSKSAAQLQAFPAARFQAHDKSSWRRAVVSDVSDLQGGLTVNARRASLPMSAGYLRVANVFRGTVDLSEVKEMGVTSSELERTRLQQGDVVVVEGHGNVAEVGRAAMIDHLPEAPLTHQNHLFRLRPRADAISGRFLELAINAPAAREYIRRVVNTTSGLNTLNATSIRSLPILVAPLAAQREIEVEIVAIVDSLRRTQARQRAVDTLFASLQHRAFRGEL